MSKKTREERREKRENWKREKRKWEERKIEEYNKNHFTSRCLRLSKAAGKGREMLRQAQQPEKRTTGNRANRFYFNCIFFGL